MDFEALSDAVFRLGRASSDSKLCNQSLLREIAEVAARFIGVETSCVVVHETGLMNPACACYAHGPWSAGDNDRFLERFRWSARDRVLAMKLSDRAPNRMYRRAELLDDDTFKESRIYTEFERPMSLGDSAVGFFDGPEGGVLVISIGMIEGHGRLTDEHLLRAHALVPFITDAWAHGWKREPRWVSDLKSNSREVLQLVLEGLDDEQIADETGLTYHSVRAHLKRLFKEAGVRSRLHLMQAYRSPRLSANGNGALAGAG